jgi:predicted transcriptional regulator
MAREMLTLRLEGATRRRLAAVARRQRRTPSAVVRDAIEAWLADEGSAAGAAPYEGMADLIGSVRGGDPKRSVRGAAAIAASLRKRQRRRPRP